MDLDKIKATVEAVLFAAGRPVEIKELMASLEIGFEQVQDVLAEMKIDYESNNRGLEIVKTDDSYQLCTKKEFYDYIYPIFDKRSKPNLSRCST